MRPPLPGLGRMNDTHAGEALCTLQMLYALGKIEADQFGAVEEQFGRQPGAYDDAKNCLRVALEFGLQLRVISPFDPQQLVGPNGLQHLADVWTVAGSNPKAVAEAAPRALSGLQAGMRNTLTHIAAHPTQVKWESRPATGKDLFDAVQGSVVRIYPRDRDIEPSFMLLPDDEVTCLLYDSYRGQAVPYPIHYVMHWCQPRIDCYTLG